MTKTIHLKDEVSIALCGSAGQGILSIIDFLTRVLKPAGYYVFATTEYMSRVRGGSNSAGIRISAKPVSAPVSRVDIMVPLDKAAIPHMEDIKRIAKDTLIIGDKEAIGTEKDIIDVPLSKLTAEVGQKIFLNTVATGMILGILNIDLKLFEEYLGRHFRSKGDDVIKKNREAARKGYDAGKALTKKGIITIDMKPNPEAKNTLFLNGNEAIVMGSLAGGCNFISSYPMSPSTGVFTLFAKTAKDFGTVVEQAEDEICALNMCLGAWYAGARAMVSTSGGGFALMAETVSLAGITETPAVIHLAMRPGPATGLPTRTGQEDLEFALYSGHGEFPRAIFAPGTKEDAFSMAQRAFEIADKYQIPVFILTDQFFLESYYGIRGLYPERIKMENRIIRTAKDYKRYRFTDSGISPRGIPGFGDGLVCVDSDEHDESGYITESMDVRSRMVDKRLYKKLALIEKDILEPELFGSKKYKTLVIGWGSTCEAVKEAVEKLGRDDVAFLYFKQVWPVHKKAAVYIEKAKKTAIIEQNATAQFAKLIKLTTGKEIGHKILKYNGLQFTVEEVIAALKKITG